MRRFVAFTFVCSTLSTRRVCSVCSNSIATRERDDLFRHIHVCMFDSEHAPIVFGVFESLRHFFPPPSGGSGGGR